MDSDPCVLKVISMFYRGLYDLGSLKYYIKYQAITITLAYACLNLEGLSLDL